jgi:hypothetical protein
MSCTSKVLHGKYVPHVCSANKCLDVTVSRPKAVHGKVPAKAVPARPEHTAKGVVVPPRVLPRAPVGAPPPHIVQLHHTANAGRLVPVVAAQLPIPRPPPIPPPPLPSHKPVVVTPPWRMPNAPASTLIACGSAPVVVPVARKTPPSTKTAGTVEWWKLVTPVTPPDDEQQEVKKQEPEEESHPGFYATQPRPSKMAKLEAGCDDVVKHAPFTLKDPECWLAPEVKCENDDGTFKVYRV